VNKILGWTAVVLAACGMFFNFPSLVIGISFLWNWIQVHASSGAYFRWSYLVAGLICVMLALSGLALAAQAVWGKRFRVVASIASLFLGLACAIELPEVGPQLDMSGANLKVLGHADHSLSDWDEAHGQFPRNAEELRSALAVRPLQEPAIYFRQGMPIPFAVRFMPNSTGPSTEVLPLGPGTIVYAVSSDYKEYWLTMTTLQNPAKGPVTWEHVGGDFRREPIWVMNRKHHNPGEGYQPFIE
jgi:hypothetical protein